MELFKDDATFEAAVRYPKGLQVAEGVLRPVPPQESERETWCFWGPPGTGKTYSAYLLDPDLFELPHPNAHSGSVWFDGYAGEQTLLIDEYTGWIQIASLRKLLDPWSPPKTVQVKGASSPFRVRRTVITSNSHPFRWHPHTTLRDLKALTRRITRAYFFDEEGAHRVDLEAKRLEYCAAFQQHEPLPHGVVLE